MTQSGRGQALRRASSSDPTISKRTFARASCCRSDPDSVCSPRLSASRLYRPPPRRRRAARAWPAPSGLTNLPVDTAPGTSARRPPRPDRQCRSPHHRIGRFVAPRKAEAVGFLHGTAAGPGRKAAPFGRVGGQAAGVLEELGRAPRWCLFSSSPVDRVGVIAPRSTAAAGCRPAGMPAGS